MTLKIKTIIGYYYPTNKNGMVKDFFGTMGFRLKSEDSEGNSIWILEPELYSRRETHIVMDN